MQFIETLYIRRAQRVGLNTRLKHQEDVENVKACEVAVAAVRRKPMIHHMTDLMNNLPINNPLRMARVIERTRPLLMPLVALMALQSSAEASELELVVLEDGRQVLGHISEADQDHLRIAMVFHGVSLGNMTVAKQRITERRQPSAEELEQLNGLAASMSANQSGGQSREQYTGSITQSIRNDTAARTTNRAAPATAPLSLEELSALDQQLAGMSEDDPQRSTVQRERLSAMLQFNAAVLRQNAANLLALPKTALTNEDALAFATDASELQSLRQQTEQYNTLLNQVEKISSEAPAELRQLRTMRLAQKMGSMENVFLADYLQDYYGSDLDQSLAFDDAFAKEGEIAAKKLQQQFDTAKGKADRFDKRIKDLESKRKRIKRKDNPKDYQAISDKINELKQDQKTAHTEATQVERWLKEAQNPQGVSRGGNSTRKKTHTISHHQSRVKPRTEQSACIVP